jgi:hypothetical protein
VSMDEADLVAAALRAQETGQVRQVEPEKRNPEQRRETREQEKQKARMRRGDFLEKSAAAEESSQPHEPDAEGEGGDQEPATDEEPRKSIDTLA